MHTEGFWDVVKVDRGFIITAKDGVYDVAIVRNIGDEDNQANAKLIAAAPDLLEALQAAVDCGMVPISSASEGGATKYARQAQVADMIRAAIKKATQ